jgi:hypothetical protein
VCGPGAIVNCNSPASIRNYDLPYFTKASSLSVQITPLSGHDLALEPTNIIAFANINNWIGTH